MSNLQPAYLYLVRALGARGEKMKAIPGLILVGAIALGLAACSGSASVEPTQASRLNADYEKALPVEVQLAVGTFKLEGTDLAVDVVEAQELIPLWQALRSLGDSDRAAAAEVQAVVDQIQETMSLDQITAIAELKLAQQDLPGLIDQLGLSPDGFPGDGGGPGDGTFQLPNGGDFVFTPGGGPGGGAGPGGGGPGGGASVFGQGGEGDGPGGRFAGGQFAGGQGNLDPDQIAALQAERGGANATAGFGGRAAGFLIDPLIELLQAKAGGGA